MAYIVNRFGIIHSIPDDWQTLPVGARAATPQEIAEFEAKDAQSKKRILADKRARAAQKVQLLVGTGGADDDDDGNGLPNDNPPAKDKKDGK